MITFQRENWADFEVDGRSIFPTHWKELALDQEAVPMSFDYSLYRKSDESDRLHVVTARNKGTLIGYLIAWVLPHPHYSEFGLMASTDMFYVLPEHRKGGLGARMLLFAQQSLRERGVKKVSISTKVHQDHSAIFEAMGWTFTDKVFMRLL